MTVKESDKILAFEGLADGDEDDENMPNEIAFKSFVKDNLNNSEFKNRFVVFVHGEFQGVSDDKGELVKKMYDKFGNVVMYVGRVTDKKNIVLLDTLDFT